MFTLTTSWMNNGKISNIMYQITFIDPCDHLSVVLLCCNHYEGLVPGPLWFLIYKNDLCNVSDKLVGLGMTQLFLVHTKTRIDEIAKPSNQELIKATICRIETPTVINPRSVTVPQTCCRC